MKATTNRCDGVREVFCEPDSAHPAPFIEAGKHLESAHSLILQGLPDARGRMKPEQLASVYALLAQLRPITQILAPTRLIYGVAHEDVVDGASAPPNGDVAIVG
jgi:hypothetical protein